MDIPFELQKIQSEIKTDRKLIHRALGTHWNALQEQSTTLSDFIDRSAARQEHFLDLLEFQAKETDDLHFRLSRVEQKLDPPAA